MTYYLFFTGVPKSDLYGVYTNDYVNHRDTIWLYSNDKGCQKIYDKNNRLVYSYKFEWKYKFIIPKYWSTLCIDGITLPDDVDFTDSLYLPSDYFRFEPIFYDGLDFTKCNDTIVLFTSFHTEIERELYFRSFYKILGLD